MALQTQQHQLPDGEPSAIVNSALHPLQKQWCEHFVVVAQATQLLVPC